MNKFINKILEEAKNGDDSFFKPKDLKKKKEEEKRKRNDFLSKIRLGLQNIREDYENRNWDSKKEELFLQIFSKFHVNEKYSKYWNGYLLKDENNKNKCVFDLEYRKLFISYSDVWRIFENEFNWGYWETEHFMNDILKKHFKLHGFTSGNFSTRKYL